MGTSDGHRWQAAMGAITASLVAGAWRSGTSSWTADGLRSLELAEELLRGRPLPIDLAVVHAAPAAIGLADGARPLLADGTASELVDVVRVWLHESRLLDPADAGLAAAADLARSGARLDDAVLTAPDVTQAVLNAAVVGLVGGIGVVPGRAATGFAAVDGRRGRRYLARLTDRLLGIDRDPTYDPRRRRGPREVLPGLWLSNVYGAQRFVETNPEGLVLSLCDPEGRIDGHPHQVTFHIDDTPRPDANPSLEFVLDEVLAEIAAARVGGQPVLVHCRHGASRTGLVLRALLVDELGVDAEAALMEAQCLWPHVSEWNPAWHRATERWAGRQARSTAG